MTNSAYYFGHREKARKIASELGPVIEFPNMVAAGKRALRNEPFRLTICIGPNLPALCGISGLISIRKVSGSAEALTEYGALTKYGASFAALASRG